MTLGRAARPPKAFVAFCSRRPAECGGGDLSAAATSGLKPSAIEVVAQAAQPALGALPAPRLLEARITAVEVVTEVAFVDPAQAAAERATWRPLPMSAGLWRLLKSVNDGVNGAIESREDKAAYGVDDYWTTPIENGRAVGDCEDFVLEKRRALVAAGLDARDLNIALVSTAWGETHAVLLVATSQGEYVLDNLTPWIRRWDLAGYEWRQRQVAGDARRWATIKVNARKNS